MVLERYPKHTFKINIKNHPKFIVNKLQNLESNQFGFDLFGLKNNSQMPLINYFKGYREKYINPIFLSKYKFINYYNEN